MIAVFDTNVLIATLITEGICAKLLHRARAGEFSLVSCPFIMKEVRRILSRKFRLGDEETASAMEPVTEAVDRIIEHTLNVKGVCRDADDDNILACALAAEAEYLVTGDADLLELKRHKVVRIITPRDFEAMFL
ncbi:MAG TPA: putative toxin-antitoxin system toxin component, PIN family [Thermodesulfovibrionales bacterium]|nr:putative toxin-antitoxin system toxin component, PIN family [Thermodesulfovibrionales bacterium]